MSEAMLFGCLIPSIYSAVTDATKRYLYDYITIPILIAGIIYSVYDHTWFNLITASVVFIFLYAMALKGGIAGGDVKFTTAIAVWFGYPSILYVLAIASITGSIFGLYKLARLGLFQKRVVAFFRGIYLRAVYGIKGVIPENKLPENDEISEEAIPFGTFLVIAAWIVYALNI